MSSVAGKMFMLVFLMIGAIALFGVMAFIVTNHAPVDATINNSLNSYYDTQQIVNQTMNKTIQMEVAGATILSPMPLLIAICVLASGLFIFMIVIKRKKG
jgi:hypothetical protein